MESCEMVFLVNRRQLAAIRRRQLAAIRVRPRQAGPYRREECRKNPTRWFFFGCAECRENPTRWFFFGCAECATCVFF
jgi:hypothetical protein